MQYKINFNDVKWQSPIEGVNAKAVNYNKKQLRLIEYSNQMEPHWCSRGHYGMILEGEMEIEFNTATVLFQAGDGVFIPDGEEHRHKARVLTEVVKVIFVEDI